MKTSPAERQELHEMAVRVASAAGLRNAATCEFLRDQSGRSWFLEVNTRLQVEHGVTELVSGVDIVHEQLWLAAGEPLSAEAIEAASRAGSPNGHAIEVRLSAEDPARDFAPTPGRIGTWVLPAGPGVRVDTGVEAGDRVPPDYDPLVAKLMVHAADRPAALARLRRALDETEVGGVQTTLPFDRHVVRDPTFLSADLSTGWVDDHWDGPASRADAVRRALLAGGLTALDVTAEGRGHQPAESDGRPDRGRGSDGRGPTAWSRDGLAEAVDRWPDR